jgi:hypothetical protein
LLHSLKWSPQKPERRALERNDEASRLLSEIVYQATPRDPVVLAGVVLAMAKLGLAATWIPARRWRLRFSCCSWMPRGPEENSHQFQGIQ